MKMMTRQIRHASERMKGVKTQATRPALTIAAAALWSRGCGQSIGFGLDCGGMWLSLSSSKRR